MKSKFMLVAFAVLLTLSGTAAAELRAGAVVYGVVPHLFGAKQPLRAVTQRLDELQAQGVDALWISPVNATNDPGWISYAVTDYFELRKDLGTPEDLKTLVRQAHRRDMKVLLDFVPNHTSDAHPFYSKFPGYYERDEKGQATHYFDWKHLPNLNYGNSRVVRHITRAFRHWVEEYDVDGFRIDAAWGVRERAPEFWAVLARELRKLKPGLVLLAEASARDPYYFANGFDIAYDWSEKLGEWSWKDLFSDPLVAPKRLDQVLSSERFSKRTLRFLNNNDTGERFITRHGAEMTRLAAVLQHALPGVALVYAGDETEAEYLPYEDPPPIDWSEREGSKALRAHYRKLAELRESLPALRSGEFLSIPSPKGEESYAFLRMTPNSEDSAALIVLNFGKKRDVVVRLPVRFRTRFEGKLHDALTGEELKKRFQGNELRFEMRSRGAVILVRKDGTS